jgi:hypothetical protein
MTFSLRRVFKSIAILAMLGVLALTREPRSRCHPERPQDGEGSALEGSWIGALFGGSILLLLPDSKIPIAGRMR